MNFEQWTATRQWASDLSPHVDADLDGASGMYYQPLGHIESRGWGWGVVIATTDEEFETLEAAERYLWDEFVSAEVQP